ncbi:hypothetical protein H0H93_009987 [Arthromyces matolae]|nr:hypothetical protein H0H93_009987 [Arthromyces matolae]
MFSSQALLSTILLSTTLATIANPVVLGNNIVKTSLTRHFNTSNARRTFREARTWKLNASDLVQESIDQKLLVYSATIGVGNPPTSLIPQRLITQAIGYGGGVFEGWEYLDRVTVADDFVIVNQSIGVANEVTFTSELTSKVADTLNPSVNSTVPTVLDNAFDQGIISNKVLGMYFQPTTQPNLTNGGEITWGGVDETKFIGDIVYTDVTTTGVSSHFWGINSAITYGKDLQLLNSTAAGIVDTGSPLLYIATDAYNAYADAVGAVFDDDVGLLRLNATQAAALKSIYLNINGVQLEVTPNAQGWAHSINPAINGDVNMTYLIVADIGEPSGLGWDFILGYAFLERYYSVFDTENNRVGFAETKFTKAIVL